MDDSPRVSKRRKLDTPTRDAPNPSAKPSTLRKSTRTVSRTIKKLDGTPKDQNTPAKNASKPSLRKANGAGRRTTVEAADVWDDIEGALGETSENQSTLKPLPSTKKRTSRKPLAEDVANDSTSTDELQKAIPRGKRGKAGVNGKSTSLSQERDAEEQDHVAEEVTTPTGRASKRAALSTSKRTQKTNHKLSSVKSTAKTGSLRKPRKTQPEKVLDIEHTLVVANPSRLKSRKQLQFRDDETIPETDDEPAKQQSSASRTATVRRRADRPDIAKTQIEESTNTGKVQVETGAEEEDIDGDAMSVDGNSILESVLDPTEPSPFNKPPSAQKERPDVPHLSDFIEPGRELDLLKKIVLERISAKRTVPLIGLDDAYKSVHQVIEHTVTAGEGNSMLLIGARGSGKTALVNKVLTEVSKDNSHDYHVVRLNGFIHTDDKIALREIWRQLGKEMELEEENGGVGKNYADTLTTLLALLSHPSEHTGEFTEQVAKAVVFIMDEFDLFAQHPRQTLLYNLFDIAQSRKAPIAVLGLTTRIDVANSLEKRVKSRFSHRYVHLSLAKTFTAFQEICKANLLIQPELLSVEERGVLQTVAKKKTGNKKPKSNVDEDALSQWNSNIDVRTHLQRLFIKGIMLTRA